MNERTGPAEPGPADAPADRSGEPRRAPAEPRQRWRVTFRREASDEALGGRELTEGWAPILRAAGLPLVTTDDAGARPRLALAAPLPARVTGEAELADLWLTEAVPAWRVREALDGRLPPGQALVAVADVWLGAPALAGRVAAADYRVNLADGDTTPETVAAACAALLAAERLPRQREKSGGVREYDLRPLLIDVRVAEAASPTAVEMRTRIHPELGTGRPEEVMAALADAAGVPLRPGSTIRRRLVLVDEL